ncbi:MAG: serine/threonine-protein kinase, partial [Pseudomonadales bacterium]
MLETGHRNALESGYRLHWYRIEAVLGQGGFGITYLAHDLNLDGPVALKEYLPMELAVRGDDQSVHSASEHHNEQYHWGLQRFTDEARTLNRFDHPNIMRVHSVFEANNTAYMVMDYEEGESLEAMLSRYEELDEERLVNITMALLDGLEVVHREGFIHRDIKPDNVYIRADGSPVLIDFGSARLALIGRTRTVTSVVSSGYAPLEQYSSRSDEQGPWTDIYSLGATLYRAVAGVKPVDAVDRIRGVLGSTRDVLPPASEVGRGRYSPGFLAAIDHALELDEQERPQTIAAWRDALLGRPATLEADGSHSSEQAAGTTADTIEDADEAQSASTATQLKPPTHRPLMRTRPVAGIAVVLAVAALIAWWQWGPSSVSNPASGPVAAGQVMVEDQKIENGSRPESSTAEKTKESTVLVQQRARKEASDRSEFERQLAEQETQ